MSFPFGKGGPLGRGGAFGRGGKFGSGLLADSAPPIPTRILQRSAILPAVPTNGMFQDQEPIESGIGDIPALIGAPGRTICMNFDRLVRPSYANATIYGVRFRLGNMSLSPISGGKLIVARFTAWNGLWTPNTSNVITGDALTGWANATVGGDPLLPIAAGFSNPSGRTLRTVWTGWVPLAGGVPWSTLQLMTRFLLPPRSVAPYALTFGNWHLTDSFSRYGVLAGRARMRWDWRSSDAAPVASVYRGEGDYVTDPTAAGNITTPTGNGFCPDNSTNFTRKYGADGAGHTPILEVQYATSLEEMA